MSLFSDILDKMAEISGGDSGNGSGSGDSTTGASSSAPALEELITGPDGDLACAFGEHLVKGHLLATKYAAGPPPSSIFIQAGGEGVWESVVTAWYAGEEIDESVASGPGWLFYPGTISTAINDATQPVNPFLPDGIAYSGTAYVAVKLPEKFSTEDRPDKFVWRAKCKKVWDYDEHGNELTFAYSVNPADIAVDRIRTHYERLYEDDLDLAFSLFRARVNWASYTEFRNDCAEEISWDNGTATVDIARFECHVVFTGAVDLASALDQITASAGAFWQDDGEQFSFVTAAPHDPVHHFHYDPTSRTRSNIIAGSVSQTPSDIRSRPNYLVAKFRDLDDPFLTEVSVVAKRPALIAKVGIVKSERAFPNMNYSQAFRLLERQLRIESDNPLTITLRGDGTSLHVLPGDYVTITHPVLNYTFQKCLVLSASPDSAEKSADECEFTLLVLGQELYSDDAQKPIQEALEP